MSDLVAFLAARLGEDEAAARNERVWFGPYPETISDADGWLVIQEERMLREVAAGRTRIALYEAARADAREFQRGVNVVVADALLEVLQADAAVYRDHPDYDPAWNQVPPPG